MVTSTSFLSFQDVWDCSEPNSESFQLLKVSHLIAKNWDVNSSAIDTRSKAFAFKASPFALFVTVPQEGNVLRVLHHMETNSLDIEDIDTIWALDSDPEQEPNLVIASHALFDFATPQALDVPSAKSLMSVFDLESLKNLKPDENEPIVWRPRNVIPIPPFLASIFVEEEDPKDFKKLFLKVVLSIKKFIQDHTSEDKKEKFPKILQGCEKILQALWIITRDKSPWEFIHGNQIPDLPLTDPLFQIFKINYSRFFSSQKNSCNLSSQANSSHQGSPTERVVSLLDDVYERIERMDMRARKSDEKEKSPRHENRIHAVALHTLLMASSNHSTGVIPDKVNEDFAQFLHTGKDQF
jgi:hypothetical protein